jgi:hypothetical protein
MLPCAAGARNTLVEVTAAKKNPLQAAGRETY